MTTAISDPAANAGGCDHGYALTPCLWGVEPEPYVAGLERHVTLDGARALDAGCGEGRNTVFLARAGATVDAVDISELALEHARRLWPDEPRITWGTADVSRAVPGGGYDVVVCDSVLHWNSSLDQARRTVRNLQAATRPGGVHVLCSFNDRAQQLDRHLNPPRLLPAHDEYLRMYTGWELLRVEDVTIVSSHADVPEPHTHSVTKILAARPR
ncbi:class I SAM-dependent methyltransferase [Phytohabitans sp. ZYX-F-186]|uniref:Class I SAM-dependent methyltransferase n=1 Tax=Phytohabitans maris TaxID=3071409 RepID=A0ABU0ZDP8_9ACTN|nr:class I SAM-dependent methyltransferase [Phytohabitans sp. ZYX-F-186]MDQ7905175.1 class I SAM-dependent methyltransferase [Phytohabitans sp. ZYX-F-186]